MIHDIDLARAIVGAEIVEQQAMARVVLTDEADLASALLRFDNGVRPTSPPAGSARARSAGSP